MSAANCIPSSQSLARASDLEILNEIYEEIIQDVTSNDDPSTNDVYERSKTILDYNITDGKKFRALILMHAFRALKLPKQCTSEELRLAAILGWCIEMFQGFFLMLDDVMDQSLTRRGKPCWYKKVGLIAINDAFLVEQIIYQILSSHFKNHECYQDIFELFHLMTLNTVHGQCFDMLSTPEGTKPDLNTFTEDRYNTIVKYKTAYYSFVFPVRLALYLASIKDLEKHKQAETILLKVGRYFQIQDDYLDCFGDFETIGKHGTDIVDSKCSWLVVQALKMANGDQRDIIEKNYGINDPVAVERVKQVYRDLNLPHLFTKLEEDSYAEIADLIRQNNALPAEIYLFCVMKIYKRKK